MPVEVDGALHAGQAGDVRVARKRPGAVRVKLHVHVALLPRRVDGAGKRRPVVEVQVERRHVVDEHIPIDDLVGCPQVHLAAVASLRPPPGSRGVQEHARCVVVHDGRTGKVDLARRVVHEEDVAV